MSLIFRIDDVSANTDLSALRKMIKTLKDMFVCEVWACVTIMSRGTYVGSVYPDVPFKDKPVEYFYDVNHYFTPSYTELGYDRVASHGLFHIDHSKFQYDAQQMSIVSSCKILGADLFVPPFNRWNQTTEAVCKHYGIHLIKSEMEGWKSLEYEPFNLKQHLWYFHPWRFTPESFKRTLEEGLDPSRND